MYIYIYIHIYIFYLYIFTYVYVYMYMWSKSSTPLHRLLEHQTIESNVPVCVYAWCVRVYVCECASACECVRAYVCVCMYVCNYVCMNVCTYVYLCIYIYTYMKRSLAGGARAQHEMLLLLVHSIYTHTHTHTHTPTSHHQNQKIPVHQNSVASCTRSLRTRSSTSFIKKGGKKRRTSTRHTSTLLTQKNKNTDIVYHTRTDHTQNKTYQHTRLSSLLHKKCTHGVEHLLDLFHQRCWSNILQN